MNTLERLSHHLQRTFIGACWKNMREGMQNMWPSRKEWVEVHPSPAQLRAKRNRDKRRGLL